MTAKKPITLRDAVERVLARVTGPITIDELAKRILAIYPSKAKKPVASIRNHLRWDHAGKTLVYLDRQTIIPLRIAMRGVRFRIRLSLPEISRGVLFVSPAFEYFLRRAIAPKDAKLLDAAGRSLAVRVVTVEQELEGPLGPSTYEIPAFDLGDWFRANEIRADDSILVTIEDWKRGCFRLEYEPASQRRQQEIERKNQELADLLFDMLESARNEQIYSHEAIPTAYARLSDPKGYPGDHWVEVIAQDSRMTWDGFTICYSDSRSLFDLMFSEEEEETLPEEPYTPTQAKQVYHFKAALRHRPGLWRLIEIQGEQTLTDFDAILRDAFNHDPGDHLGGFWKRIRRGKSKRFREVDLGEIDPWGEGSGADLHVAGLGLKPGDELKYVYDFGDWIEHLITLEEIIEPEAEEEYPRIVAQNKPRYEYCRSCQAKGRKAVATWVCIECSNVQQKAAQVCEECLVAKHEDHYAEEMIY